VEEAIMIYQYDQRRLSGLHFSCLEFGYQHSLI
jgi:hypothetical protein